MSLAAYRRKRDFRITSEPSPGISAAKGGRYRFVIQKHDATRLHFDFRLELGGVLVSWAVPKGLPLLHGEKRLAVKVEDHPLSYVQFEGVIPKGQYGGGTVQVWDIGKFEPVGGEPLKELEGGKLHLKLHGEKLSGEWYLVRLRDENQWLVIRGGEDHRRLTKRLEDNSVLTGRTMRQIARAAAPGSTPLRSTGSTNGEPAPARSARKPTRPLTAKSPDRDSSAFLTVKASDFIEPMKAKLVALPPDGDWEYEVKFDGFRALAYKEGDAVALLSRTNKRLTEKFPELARAVQGIDAKDAVIDGEIVALDAAGRSSFQHLQAKEGGEQAHLYYYVFDLLKLNGKDLSRLPLEDRKRKLQSLVPSSGDVIRFSASLGRDALALIAMARHHGLEGIIGKRSRSPYQPGLRTGDWIKIKLTREQEFVIGGYTEPTGTRSHFGALLVGYYEKGQLRYAGKVGTGFGSKLIQELYQRFSQIRRTDCPFSDLPETRSSRYGQGITASVMKRCHWLQPMTVAQVKFSEWTRDSRLRQPVFIGLREDKSPKNVIRETPS